MATANLGLPLIEGGQAQKHVTHNEALAMLDALLPSVVVSATVSAAPVAPVEGEAYIVPVGGRFGGVPVGQIALYLGGMWSAVPGRFGMSVFVLDEGCAYVFAGSAGWMPGAAVGRFGGAIGVRVLDYEVSLTGGPSVTVAGAIPPRSIVLSGSMRVIEAISGPGLIRIGDGSSASRFGQNLNTSAGATNVGLVTPYAAASGGNLVVSSNNGSTVFTGGLIRVSLAVICPSAPL